MVAGFLTVSRSCLRRQSYTALVTALAEYEHSIAVDWARKVEKSSDAKLRLTLLTRDDSADNLLRVTFSPDLVCMLR